MRRIAPYGCAVAATALVVGCQPSPLSNEWAEPRPLGRDVESYQPPKEPPDQADSAESNKIEQPTGTLTLPKALSLALKGNPELASFGWEVRAAEARRLQAGLYPNPEAELEVEEFGGSGPRRGVDAAKSKVRLGQPIPLAGKVEKRVRVAKLDRKLAGWDYEAKRLDVFTTVVKRFIEVVAAQRRVDVAERTFELAKQTTQTVTTQVEAGEVSPVEQTRAEVELSRNRIELKSARRELKAARQALVETWGGDAAKFAQVKGNLSQISKLPELQPLTRLVDQNPRLARWATEMAKRRARVELAEARKWPNVKVTGGLEHNSGANDTTGILSVGMPLPIFDRNQGNILESRFNVAKARQERRAAYANVRSMLGQQYQRLQDAYQTVTTLRDETLPGARSAYQSTRQSYDEGQASLLDVLDAQRTLFQVEGRYVKALAEYHSAAAEVERLIAQPLAEIGPSAQSRPATQPNNNLRNNPTEMPWKQETNK